MIILKSIGAVLTGMIFIVATHMITDLIMENVLGIFPKQGVGYLEAAIALAYRTILTIVGGYLTAILAPSKPMTHAVILGVIGLVICTIAAIFTIPMNLGPAWYPIALALLAVPSTWLGGKIAEARASARA